MRNNKRTSDNVICSVCIANYNGIDLIDDCIRSVLAQQGDLPTEIIIHDDASTDGSANHIRDNYPDVKIIGSDKNVGFCAANNRMAAIAKGQYLLLLNNDATLLPDALTTLYTASQTLLKPSILTLPQYDAETGLFLDSGNLLDPFLNPIPNKELELYDVGMVAGACLWIPKTLWDSLGGFPEWFGSFGEDLYLCCKARLTGYTVRALGISGYRHHIGHSFGGGRIEANKLRTTFQRRALSERNKTFVMTMTYPAPVMQLALALHLCALVFEGIALTIIRARLSYLTKIYLPVFLALFQQRHMLAQYRRNNMKHRTISTTNFFSVFVFWPYKLVMLLRHGLPRVD